MDKKEIIKELRAILKVYHYESKGTKYLDKGCVTRLENLLGSLLKGGQRMELEKNDNMDGTHLVGRVETTYKNLVEKLGLPHHDYQTEPSKVSVEWSLRFPKTNDVVTIYNWKDGKNYLGDDEGDEVEKITDWHIGGYNSKVVPMIKEVINK